MRDPRFHARDWRNVQNFVGSIARGYRHEIDHVCPKPEDVPGLMAGLGGMATRLYELLDPIVVETRDLYRFFDATAVAEYLYERVIETLRKDPREELEFVEVYDRVNRALTEQLDGLLGPKVSLPALLCLQNGGRLARGERRLFEMLTDAEIGQAEELVQLVSAATDAERAERTSGVSGPRPA